MLVLQHKYSLYSLNYTFSGVTSEQFSAIFAAVYCARAHALRLQQVLNLVQPPTSCH